MSFVIGASSFQEQDRRLFRRPSSSGRSCCRMLPWGKPMRRSPAAHRSRRRANPGRRHRLADRGPSGTCRPGGTRSNCAGGISARSSSSVQTFDPGSISASMTAHRDGAAARRRSRRAPSIISRTSCSVDREFGKIAGGATGSFETISMCPRLDGRQGCALNRKPGKRIGAHQWPFTRRRARIAEWREIDLQARPVECGMRAYEAATLVDA